MNHPARSADPQTSHDAARHIVASGAQALQQNQTLDAVAGNPGLTSNELARATGLDRYMLARRLPELCDSDRVVRGDARRCSVSGRSAATWWPVVTGVAA